MLGSHCLKTWSSTQHAIALSSAEAELYGMVEGVTRSRGLLDLVVELGMTGLSQNMRLWTDSSAAKSFISRHGTGRMRHLQIRDLWLQKEVADGRITCLKIPGHENPADLMTKSLGLCDIRSRLDCLGIQLEILDGSSSRSS